MAEPLKFKRNAEQGEQQNSKQNRSTNSVRNINIEFQIWQMSKRHDREYRTSENKTKTA